MGECPSDAQICVDPIDESFDQADKRASHQSIADRQKALSLLRLKCKGM